MEKDAFSRCHPAVNFIFFIGAIAFGVVIQHPAYLLVGMAASTVYYLLLKGKKGLKFLCSLLPFLLLIAAVNPLFNTRGQHTLFHIFGRPYTLEALLYGAAIAAVFAVMTLWFGCYNAVMTGDKFTSLFANLIPSLSLLLVMVFRMIPSLIGKGRQLAGARKSLGKGAGALSSGREKLADGMTVLSSLASWALEGSLVTADSMRARGYGTAKRSSFRIYRMTLRDWLLLWILLFLLAVLVFAALFGSMSAAYTPALDLAPVRGVHIFGLLAYCVYVFLPTALQIKEALLWHFSKFKI